MRRLAALEAEVKSDVDAQRARKEAALAKVREQRAQQQAERDALRTRQAELVTRKPQPRDEPRRAPARGRRDDDDDDGHSGDELGSALALAKKAHGVKQELTRPAKAGEKSWVKSGIASALLGPLGWLYAGSLREAVPASAAWLAFGYIATQILPVFLLMPVMLVALPLSGIAGAIYAIQYNRTGKRQRLFNNDDKRPKQLRGDDV